MTRAGLIDEVSRLLAIPRVDAERVIDTIFESMAAALARGEKIELRGFGTFRLRLRRARKAHNPKTHALFDVPATRFPLFKPGSELRRTLARHAPRPS